jgi:hypothetical protein
MATGLAAPWPLKSVLDNVAGNHPAPLWISWLLPVLGTDRTHHEIRPNGSSPRRDRRHGRDHCLGRALRLREGAEGARTHHARHTDGYVAGRFSPAAGHACSAPPAPTEKSTNPTGGNLFSPPVKAPGPPTPAPGNK